MGDPQPIVCRTCARPLTPKTLGHSRYARSLPMCAGCEDNTLMNVRPSPRDRQEKGYKQR